MPPPELAWLEGPSPTAGSGSAAQSFLTPQEDEERLSYLGCPMDLVLAAEDSLGYFDVQISFLAKHDALMEGAKLSPQRCSRGEATPIPGQDTTGILNCVRAERTLVYTPLLSQQGLRTRVCFSASTQTSHTIERCFRIFISKCRYCVQPGESLEGVARTFSTDWLQLFSANSHIHTPQHLAGYQLLNLGALYPVRPGDTLASIQQRFQGSIAGLQRANPEVTDIHATMPTGTMICVLPAICLPGGF